AAVHLTVTDTVFSEEDHAVPGPTNIIRIVPRSLRIQVDDALDPPWSIEINPLVAHAQVAFDDGPPDRLEIDNPGVAFQVAAQPPSAVGLYLRSGLRQHGPVIEHTVVQCLADGMSPPLRLAVHHHRIGADMLTDDQRHPHMPRR